MGLDPLGLLTLELVIKAITLFRLYNIKISHDKNMLDFLSFSCNPGSARHLLSQDVTGNDASGVLKVLTVINYGHQMTHLDTSQGTLRSEIKCTLPLHLPDRSHRSLLLVCNYCSSA